MGDLAVVGLARGDAARSAKAWAYIAPALEYGSMETIESLKVLAATGGAQLWGVCRDGAPIAAMLTQIVDRPKGRVCVIVAAGGDNVSAQGCAEAIEQITPWARSLGCEQFEINGRPGWGRHLSGWNQAHVTHRRAIT